jgi:hypothetical protein
MELVVDALVVGVRKELPDRRPECPELVILWHRRPRAVRDWRRRWTPAFDAV